MSFHLYGYLPYFNKYPSIYPRTHAMLFIAKNRPLNLPISLQFISKSIIHVQVLCAIFGFIVYVWKQFSGFVNLAIFWVSSRVSGSPTPKVLLDKISLWENFLHWF